MEEYLKAYESLGVLLKRQGKTIQATGECPFCGREKFSINIKTGQGHCWACPRLLKLCNKEGFNLLSFIRLLWRDSYSDGRGLSIISKAKNLPIEELIRWGFRFSKTGKIIVPGYDCTGRIIQLFRWEVITGKGRMIATPNLPLGFTYIPSERNKNPIYLCEGLWDAIVSRMNIDKGQVVSIPGANVFKEEWAPFFKGKDVKICYDNDIAGKSGTEKLIEKLSSYANSIYYILWPKGIPDKYDIRDYFTDNPKGFHKLQKMFVPANPKISLSNQSFEELISFWEKAMSWNDTLTKVLAILLATCINTFVKGEQIWLRLIGAPASGKTTFCEALGLLKEYVTIVSTMTGFYSGWIGEDQSLIGKLKGKILITKDADTLIQSPNLKQILGEARDIYDGYGRAIYRNAVDREYSEVRITWILAGTSLIATFGDRELGERFINVTTYRVLPDNVEAQLAYKKIAQTLKHISQEGTEKPRDLQRAMIATASYLKMLIKKLEMDNDISFNLSEEEQIRIYHLASFTARLRARPSKLQTEFIEREICTRLCSQFTKLLYCLTRVFQITHPDEKCWNCLLKVAIDTSDGISYQLVSLLYKQREMTTSQITSEIPGCKRILLDYLCSIGILNKKRKKQLFWSLTDDFRELYELVLG